MIILTFFWILEHTISEYYHFLYYPYTKKNQIDNTHVLCFLNGGILILFVNFMGLDC